MSEQIGFEIVPPEEWLDERADRLEEVTWKGRRIKRLELWGIAETREWLWIPLNLRKRVPELKELSLRRSWKRADGHAGEDYHDMYRADDYLRGTNVRCPLVNSLPISLRFLSIAHLEMKQHDWQYVTALASLEVLLVTDAGFSASFEPLSHKHSNLRILGLKSAAPLLRLAYLPLLFSGLRHLALIGTETAESQDWTAPPAPPTNLDTLLILFDSFSFSTSREFTRFGEIDTQLRAFYEEAGVKADIRWMYEDDKEVDWFDLEEWAVSVGSLE